MTKPSLTQARLKELLDYDPETGVFRWSPIPRSGVTAGSIAGRHTNNISPNGSRYVLIQVDGRPYLAHRLAWFYVHGVWPNKIDHKNRIRWNNWIDNLRDTNLVVNQHNRWGAQRSSRIGLQGVKKNGPGWSARIKVMGRCRHLGTFKSPELAHAVYLDAKKTLHADCL